MNPVCLLASCKLKERKEATATDRKEIMMLNEKITILHQCKDKGRLPFQRELCITFAYSPSLAWHGKERKILFKAKQGSKEQGYFEL